MQLAGFDLHAIILAVVSTGALGKLFLMVVRTMPPPPQNCGFWCRWFYDFLQLAGENADKIGLSKPKENSNGQAG